jgi:dTDP-4-dehydrorhamnose 3,5-epimerase-like enzyme
MRYHADWRRQFWGDIFDTPHGDINIVRPCWGVPIGWHRHQRQEDRLWVISGALRVRLFFDSPADGIEWMLGPRSGHVVGVPENHWHGYEAMSPDTIVLQYNSPGKWDGSDEERLSFDEVPWDIWKGRAIDE